MRKYIEEYCDQNEISGVLFIEGHDNAILGLASCCNTTKLVYSYQKIMDNLQKDMTYEDALDFFSFNVQGSYLGDGTPIIMHDEIDWESYK